jgi:diaminopimelate decarboxylase
MHHNNLRLNTTLLKNISQQYGTPTYVYDEQQMIGAFKAYQTAFGTYPHQICYAVKANGNLNILHCLQKQGAGFDIVSGGELYRALQVGTAPNQIIFSGVGKTDEEIQYALDTQIACFNIESTQELYRIAAIAKQRSQKAPIALRVNPNIDAKTHAYIATGLNTHKFGIPIEEALTLYQTAQQFESLSIEGLNCHIGSQMSTLAPLESAAKVLLEIKLKLNAQGIPIHHLNVGGGLGIAYHDRDARSTPGFPTPQEWVRTLLTVFQKTDAAHCTIRIEPGRSIVGTAGVLLTRVLYQKSNHDRHFLIVDAAMNDLLRPALYGAEHRVVSLESPSDPDRAYDIVGPVCESADFIAKQIPLSAKPDDILAILDTGAYGFSMSSQYNARPRAAEVMLCGDQYRLIRSRETYEILLGDERQWLQDGNHT